MDLATGRVYITSHNHGFAAALPRPKPSDSVRVHACPAETSRRKCARRLRGHAGPGEAPGAATWAHVPAQAREPFGTPYGPAVVTHVNLNDGVVEGLRLLERPGVQRAVPPRGRARPARRGGPLRPVLRPDGERPMRRTAFLGRFGRLAPDTDGLIVDVRSAPSPRRRTNLERLCRGVKT